MDPRVVWTGELSRVDASVATSSVRVRVKLVGDAKVAPGIKRLSDTPANQVGRLVDLTFTPAEAEKFIAEIQRSVAAARASVTPAPPAEVPGDMKRRMDWKYGGDLKSSPEAQRIEHAKCRRLGKPVPAWAQLKPAPVVVGEATGTDDEVPI